MRGDGRGITLLDRVIPFNPAFSETLLLLNKASSPHPKGLVLAS